MQNIGSVRKPTVSPANHRKRRKRYYTGSQPEKKNGSTARGCFDFLKQEIPSYPVVDDYFEEIPDHVISRDFFTPENYAYLLRSVQNYARLIGAEFTHQEQSDPAYGFTRLYNDFSAIVDQDINLEYHGDKPYFVLYKTHAWDYYTCYWIPLRFVKKLRGTFKKIVISFLTDFCNSNNLENDLEQMEDFERACQWKAENLSDCEEDEKRRLIYLLKQYGEKGNYLPYMQKVTSTVYYSDLETTLQKYTPKNEWESQLRDCLLEGMIFLYNDHSIMSFDYDPDGELEPDWYPVELDRLIRFVYNPDDAISDCLLDLFNMEQQDARVLTPVSYCVLTPETTEIFDSYCNYPELFQVWIDKFVKLIHEIL